MAREEDIELIKSRALHMLEEAKFHLKRGHSEEVIHFVSNIQV